MGDPGHPVGIPVPVPALISRDDGRRSGARSRTASSPAAASPDRGRPVALAWTLTCGHCHRAIQSVNNHGVRYYRRARHGPSIARHARKPVCTIRDVFATALKPN